MSKELEALYVLCGQIVTEMGSDEYYKCKEARDIIEKHLNALEIMKLKGKEIYIPAIQKSSDITSYLLRVGAQSTTLTQEEFEVLKEVFK